jgi:hypothetical protein
MNVNDWLTAGSFLSAGPSLRAGYRDCGPESMARTGKGGNFRARKKHARNPWTGPQHSGPKEVYQFTAHKVANSCKFFAGFHGDPAFRGGQNPAGRAGSS